MAVVIDRRYRRRCRVRPYHDNRNCHDVSPLRESPPQPSAQNPNDEWQRYIHEGHIQVIAILVDYFVQPMVHWLQQINRVVVHGDLLFMRSRPGAPCYPLSGAHSSGAQPSVPIPPNTEPGPLLSSRTRGQRLCFRGQAPLARTVPESRMSWLAPPTRSGSCATKPRIRQPIADGE